MAHMIGQICLQILKEYLLLFKLKHCIMGVLYGRKSKDRVPFVQGRVFS